MDFAFKLHSSFSSTALNTTNQSMYPNTQQTMLKGQSSAALKNPYPQTKPSKFPKGKNVRKQTNTTMLHETRENNHTSSIKNFAIANRTTLFDIKENRKMKSYGLFHSLSLQSHHQSVSNRSFQDLGIGSNRRNLGKYRINNPDPILIGSPSQPDRAYLTKIQKQPRRQRDRGNRISEHTIWQKVKPKTYLEKFRAKNAAAQR